MSRSLDKKKYNNINWKRLKTFKFIRAVSGTVLDMINATYYDKPLISIEAIYTFEFIKAVSDTVLNIINAIYHDKHLIFIRAIRLS